MIMREGKRRAAEPVEMCRVQYFVESRSISMVSLSGIVVGDSPVIDEVRRIVDHDSPRANLRDVTKRVKVEHLFGDIV